MTPTPSNRFARLSHRHLPLLLTLLCALVLAGCLLPTLETRPMHHDEANQAYSARRLLDFHGYRFKPEDHHGPTLYYALLPVAWLRGVFSGADEKVWMLRYFSGMALLMAAVSVAGYFLMYALVDRKLNLN